MHHQYFHVVVDRRPDAMVLRRRLPHSACGTDFRERQWMDHQCVAEIQFRPRDGEKMDERQNRDGLIRDADLTSVVVARLCQQVAVVVAVFQKDCCLGGELLVVVPEVAVFQKDCCLGGELPVV